MDMNTHSYSNRSYFCVLPFLRVPSAYNSAILPGDLFPGILFTCRNAVTAFLLLLLTYSSKHPRLS